MDRAVIAGYVERIYGYAFKRTLSRDEADELTQEILFEALKCFDSLRDEKKLEPWLWGLANNVTKAFKRKRGRERAMYAYDSFDTEQYNDEYPFENEEIYADIRRKISTLSSIYRDIIILYYYDNLTCKEISQKLGVPEGTVTWRLSEGRTKLKKECIEMTETALRPVKLTIRINGNGNYNGKDRPFPWVYINNALSQNILWHSYDLPKSIEELSILCGVPAYYIEDAAQNLLEREAIVPAGKGKYQTNMIIYNGEEVKYDLELRNDLKSKVAVSFINTLKSFTKAVIETGVYTAGRSENELAYLFGILALEHLSKKYNPIPFVPYKVRYDGNEWTYHAFVNTMEDKESIGFGAEKSLNEGSEGSIAHMSYHFGSFAGRPMMTTDNINICERILYGIDCPETLKEKIAILIKDGILKSEQGRKITVNIPYLSLEQKKKFDMLAESYFEGVMPDYMEYLKKYADGYQKLFPANLKDDVQRACHYLFTNMFTRIVLFGQELALLEAPSSGSVCDVLVQWKEHDPAGFIKQQ